MYCKIRVGDQILAAILRGQPQQIAQPGTSPQAFSKKKVLLLLFFRYFDDDCMFTGNFRKVFLSTFFDAMIQHDWKT